MHPRHLCVKKWCQLYPPDLLLQGLANLHQRVHREAHPLIEMNAPDAGEAPFEARYVVVVGARIGCDILSSTRPRPPRRARPLPRERRRVRERGMTGCFSACAATPSFSSSSSSSSSSALFEAHMTLSKGERGRRGPLPSVPRGERLRLHTYILWVRKCDLVRRSSSSSSSSMALFLMVG